MKSVLILLTVLIFGNAGMQNGVPIYFNENTGSVYSPSTSETGGGTVLEGNVVLNKDLPEEIYGTWAVKSTIIETNNPHLFNRKSLDLWVFGRIGEFITLSNPLTGATSSIIVNKVVGKKAKFVRRKIGKYYTETETPEIIIEENSFSGTDTIIFEHFRKGEIYKTDVVKYKLEGLKLSGPALKNLFAK